MRGESSTRKQEWMNHSAAGPPDSFDFFAVSLRAMPVHKLFRTYTRSIGINEDIAQWKQTKVTSKSNRNRLNRSYVAERCYWFCAKIRMKWNEKKKMWATKASTARSRIWMEVNEEKCDKYAKAALHTYPIDSVERNSAISCCEFMRTMRGPLCKVIQIAMKQLNINQMKKANKKLKKNKTKQRKLMVFSMSSGFDK